MSEHPDTRPPGGYETEWVTVSPRQQLADHWGLVLTYGILTFGLGLILAVWPGETIVVVAFLLAFQLIISGSTQLFLALASSSLHGLARWFTALAGVLAIVAGVLCVVAPLQTLTFVSFVVGAWLILAGLADVVGAMADDRREHRLWGALLGLFSVIVGGFLVINPERSLELLVIVACAWLLGYGFMTIIAAFRFRSEGHAASAEPGTAQPPSPAT